MSESNISEKHVVFLQVTATRSARDRPETSKRSCCPRAASRQETLLETRAVTRATRTWSTVMTAFLVCDSPALLFLLSLSCCLWSLHAPESSRRSWTAASCLSSAFIPLSAAGTTREAHLLSFPAFGGPEHLSSTSDTTASVTRDVTLLWGFTSVHFHSRAEFLQCCVICWICVEPKEWKILVQISILFTVTAWNSHKCLWRSFALV